MIAERIDEFLDHMQAQSVKVARVHIESLARAEEWFGKELCDFSKQELVSAVKADTKSYYAISDKIAIAQQYYRWTYGDNHSLSIVAADVDLSDVFRETMYPSFDRLYGQMTGYDDGDAIRPILCLSWLGLTYDQMVNVREDNVVISDNGMVTVVCDGQTFADKNVKLALALRRYMATEELLSANKQCQYTLPLVRNGYLIRKTSKSKNPETPLTKALVQSKLNSCGFNSREIAFSGQFFRALSDKRSDGAKFQEWRTYLTYIHWKKAFGYEQ